MASRLELGDDWDGYVDDLVNTGRFESPTAVIREGLRMVREREDYDAYVEQAIAEGLADSDAGRIIDADIVFAELRARFSGR